jgi:hypothetical protein
MAGQGSHYETNSLINSLVTEDSIGFLRSSRKTSIEEEVGEAFPNSLATMAADRKNFYTYNLIRESYLFVDLSDHMEEAKSSDAYESLLKHELFKEDQSLCQSFISEARRVDQLEQAFRVNEYEMVCLLEGYVRFCRKVKHDFAAENERFLGRLSLNLQGQIIAQHREADFSGNTQLLLGLKEDIEEALDILIVTV